MALIIARTGHGVFGEMTMVNKLKKNTVAFGFKTFVKNPIFIAEKVDISAFF